MITDEEYLAGRERTITKMMSMCEWIPADELVVRVDQPHALELVVSWEREGQIFSVPSARGAMYPRFEFDAEMRPLPVIKDILDLLSEDDAFGISSWFIFENDWITGLVDGRQGPIAPMHALDDRDAVLTAARNSTGTYYA